MRKEAVQARQTIEGLGFVQTGTDTRGHPVFSHPAVADDQVKLSLSPSDGNGPVRSVTAAHKALGLPPPRAAGKRRPAAIRGVELRRRRARSVAQRAAHRAAAVEAARLVRVRVGTARELEELNGRIRGLTAQLRECRTQAERAAIEQEAIPLVQRRRSLLARTA